MVIDGTTSRAVAIDGHVYVLLRVTTKASDNDTVIAMIKQRFLEHVGNWVARDARTIWHCCVFRLQMVAHLMLLVRRACGFHRNHSSSSRYLACFAVCTAESSKASRSPCPCKKSA